MEQEMEEELTGVAEAIAGLVRCFERFGIGSDIIGSVLLGTAAHVAVEDEMSRESFLRICASTYDKVAANIEADQRSS